MDFITSFILIVLFTAPAGDTVSVIPVPDEATCEIVANMVVGMIDYECLAPAGESV